MVFGPCVSWGDVFKALVPHLGWGEQSSFDFPEAIALGSLVVISTVICIMLFAWTHGRDPHSELPCPLQVCLLGWDPGYSTLLIMGQLCDLICKMEHENGYCKD